MKLDEMFVVFKSWILLHGGKILLAVVIFIIAQWLIRLLRRWIRKLMIKEDVDATLQPFLLSLISIVLQLLMIFALMDIVGVKVTIFTALIGAFGVAAGLALSGTLQNFMSGILILLLKPYRVGDNITAQGQSGIVTSIQIFYTVVLTFDNRTVIIPNSKLSNEVIVNTSMEGKRRLDVEMKFNYGIAYSKVKDVLQRTLSEHKNVLKDPDIRIGISSLEPDGYKVMINVWLQAHGFIDTKLVLQEKILDELLKELNVENGVLR